MDYVVATKGELVELRREENFLLESQGGGLKRRKKLLKVKCVAKSYEASPKSTRSTHG